MLCFEELELRRLTEYLGAITLGRFVDARAALVKRFALLCFAPTMLAACWLTLQGAIANLTSVLIEGLVVGRMGCLTDGCAYSHPVRAFA